MLRGFAAVAVMCSHYFNWWNQHVGEIPVPEANYGYHAVQLFFAISGIVIFNTLNRCSSVLQFGYLRFSRLYPTYWASLLIVVFLSWLVFGYSPWWGGLIVNATMLQEFLGYPHFDYVYWSLTVELIFYFHAAWVFALGWHRKVFQVCGAWLGLSCLWALLIGKGEDRDVWSMYLALDQSAFFVLGIMISDMTRNGFSRWHGFMIAFACLTATLIEGATGFMVWSLAAAMVLLASYGKLALVTNPITLWLGSISYSLYLVHRNLGLFTVERLASADVPWWIAIPPTMVAALLLAWLITLLVERPSLTFLRKFRIGQRSRVTAHAT